MKHFPPQRIAHLAAVIHTDSTGNIARFIPNCQTQEHIQHPLLPLFSNNYSQYCKGRRSLDSQFLVCLGFCFFLGFQLINISLTVISWLKALLKAYIQTTLLCSHAWNNPGNWTPIWLDLVQTSMLFQELIWNFQSFRLQDQSAPPMRTSFPPGLLPAWLAARREYLCPRGFLIPPCVGLSKPQGKFGLWDTVPTLRQNDRDTEEIKLENKKITALPTTEGSVF